MTSMLWSFSGPSTVSVWPCTAIARPHLPHFVHDGADVLRLAVGDRDAPAGESRRRHEGAGLDPVRNDFGRNRSEGTHSADGDLGGPGAGNFRTHAIEDLGQRHHLRLAGGVAQDRRALGQDGCHQDVFRAGDGDDVEVNFRTPQPFGGRRDISVLQGDLGPQGGQPLQVQVDRPRADRAAAGKRHPGALQPRDQRAQAPAPTRASCARGRRGPRGG